MTKSPDQPKPEPKKPGRVRSQYELLDVPDVLSLTKWSLGTLNERVAAGDFPQPIEGERGMKRKWTLAQYETWAKRKQDEVDKVA